MLIVRIRSAPETSYEGMWMTFDTRLILATDGKLVTSVPMVDLEVRLAGGWVPLLSAWCERQVAFLGFPTVKVSNDNTDHETQRVEVHAVHGTTAVPSPSTERHLREEEGQTHGASVRDDSKSGE